jgi:hypothetical protein
MASTLSGMSVSQYLTASPTSRAAADQTRDTAAIKAALRAGAEEWIKEQISRAGGNVSHEMAAQIGEDLLVKFYPNDPYALAMVVGTISGIPDLSSNPQKAATWIVQQYATGGVAAAAGNKISAADKKKAQGISENNRVRPDQWGHTTRNSLDPEAHGGFLGFGSDHSKAYDAYKSWMEKTGDQDPVIHHLINAVKGDDKAKVVVSTKDGKRVVSFAEAIKKHRNELASGKAIVLEEGKGKGQSVKDIVGEDKVDPLRDFSKEAKAEDKSGESYDAWEKKHTKTDKSGRKELQLSLTPEARRLLTILDNTGVSGSSATANPPLSPYAANPSWQE